MSVRFLEALAARRRFGMKPGLDTIGELCARLGNPQRDVKSIHVAGTNGKGAVCAIVDSVLRANGMHVGRYTSPHLVKLNERFFLDGLPVSDALLDETARQVDDAVQSMGDVTFFEALTAVAFRLYANAQVDHLVLECGLGGRLDATNVCSPEICVITRIGRDHCDWLGDTLPQIAAEKAGIIKPGVPVVLGRNADEVVDVVERCAREVGAPFFYAPDMAVAVPENFSLPGKFNHENAVTALAVLELLGVEVKGIDQVVWPGRFQRVGNFLIDGAHNPPAATALVESIGGEKLNLIAGFCGDKDAEEVLRILSPCIAHGYAVKTCNPRSLSAAEVADRMMCAGIVATPCRSLREAMEMSGYSALICGSLFLAGEALMELSAYPWPIDSGEIDPSELLKGHENIKLSVCF